MYMFGVALVLLFVGVDAVAGDRGSTGFDVGIGGVGVGDIQGPYC